VAAKEQSCGQWKGGWTLRAKEQTLDARSWQELSGLPPFRQPIRFKFLSSLPNDSKRLTDGWAQLACAAVCPRSEASAGNQLLYKTQQSNKPP
jgi:hypothetical protein